MTKFFASIALGAVLVLGLNGVAAANVPPQNFINEQVGSAGPKSFQMFCALNPAECMPGGAARVALDDETARVIASINSRVNRAIRPRLDSVFLQMRRVNPRSGDCKSYVVSKRHELIRAGLPASALRIAFVRTRAGAGHAVLIVKTDEGDLVLDNLTGEIKTLRDTGYRLVAMSQTDPKRWS